MLEKTQKSTSRRLHLIDELRGFWILNMLIYHGIWDLIYIFGVRWNFFAADWVGLWQQVGASSFIFISGFCWQMSRKPFKRGMEVFLAGLVITIVTLLVMPDSQVLFGILTLMGSCMLLMIPLDKIVRNIPPWLGVIASLIFFLILYPINDGYLGFANYKLIALPRELYSSLFSSYLGLTEPGFFSTDYFPLLPWFAMFIQGYFFYSCLNKYKETKISQKILNLLELSLCPFFGWVGRNSLIIYMLHQPLTYGLLYLIMM